MDIIDKIETAQFNFSPVGFRIVAEDLLLYHDSFKPKEFSLVPFFLCCRAIELGLKALHLETRKQSEVKKDFGHDLKALYDALPSGICLLSPSEETLLRETNDLYISKAFEYMHPYHAGHGFSIFPHIIDLENLARRIVNLSKDNHMK
jgi:hypothetical protein